jgi:hypothetical protein
MASSSSTPGNFDASLRQSPAIQIEPRTVVKRARQAEIPWLTNAIEKHAKWLIVLSLLPWVMVFNGRWRIGLDSPIYRGLADNLLQGAGYHFGDFGSHQIYPGFPLLLAGVQSIFGNSVFRPVPQILVITLLGLATVVMTYVLVSRHFPKWIAVSATCALAGNARFMTLINELLTDVPFMFGMVASMLGWSLFSDARTSTRRALSGSLAFFGLLFAASMRPAFWFFAMAWFLISLWGLIRGPRSTSAMTLAMLGLGVLLFTALDPRTRGFHPLAGGYEQEFLDVVSSSGSMEHDARMLSLVERVKAGTTKLFTEHLPAAVLGQDIPSAAGVVFSILLVLNVLIHLMRKQPLWGLLIIITLATTPLLSTPPRYYVVLVPFLAVAMLMGSHAMAQKLPGGWGGLVTLTVLMFVTGMNISKWLPLVREQHAVPLSDSSLAFYDHYRDGRFGPYIRMASLIQEKTAPGERVVSPQASVVKYLSQRDVMLERELLPAKKDAKKYPEHLAAMGLNFVVTPYKYYRAKDPLLARLIEKGVIFAGERVAKTGKLQLRRATVVVQAGDWRKNPSISTTQPIEKKKLTPAQLKKKKLLEKEKKLQKQSKLQKQLQKEKALKKKKKKKKAATQPATAPSAFLNEYWPSPQYSEETEEVRGLNCGIRCETELCVARPLTLTLSPEYRGEGISPVFSRSS